MADGERSVDEVAQLSSYIERLGIFERMAVPPSGKTAVCKLGRLWEGFRVGTLVVPEGKNSNDDPGCPDSRSFYAVLSGALKLRRKGEENRDSDVRELVPGGSYGEGALYDADYEVDGRVEVAESCKLFQIRRAEFIKVVEPILKADLADKMRLLSRVSAFADWDIAYMSELASAMLTRRYVPGDIICAEDSTLSEFMIVRQGTCVLTKSLDGSGQVEVQKRRRGGKRAGRVKSIGQLWSGDTIGIEWVMDKKPVQYTCRAETMVDIMCAKVNDAASILGAEAQIKLKERSKAVPSKAELAESYNTERAWERYRRALLRTLKGAQSS